MLAILLVGGRLAEQVAVGLAETLGLTQELIGVTVVAIATSLPELATSIIAIRKGQTDIAVGNIVGSNIFNILLVMGVTTMVRPWLFRQGAGDSLLVMRRLSALLIPICSTAAAACRWIEGLSSRHLPRVRLRRAAARRRVRTRRPAHPHPLIRTRPAGPDTPHRFAARFAISRFAETASIKLPHLSPGCGRDYVLSTLNEMHRCGSLDPSVANRNARCAAAESRRCSPPGRQGGRSFNWRCCAFGHTDSML
ncbi:MAG: hypothetical protein U5R31_13045 [Acidimicrobiia bacterium]|nr:hypothetical protein [Acidimicrobiia bacterium]